MSIQSTNQESDGVLEIRLYIRKYLHGRIHKQHSINAKRFLICDSSSFKSHSTSDTVSGELSFGDSHISTILPYKYMK